MEFLSWFKELIGLNSPQVESMSYFTLDVRVIRARIKKSKDLMSESDLYVTLFLPTSTATTRRTKTINKNNNPEWDQDFSFRVPKKTKNILEIRVLDEDLLSRDDLVSMVLLDLDTLEMDSRIRRTFNLSPETGDELELEFELKDRKEKSKDYRTNGILMAPPLSVINIKVNNLSQSSGLLSRSPQLKLAGAYEKDHVVKDQEWLKFHVNSDLHCDLGLEEVEVKLETDKQEVVQTSVHLKPLPPRHRQQVSLTSSKATLGLSLSARERSKQDLGVRLSLDLCSQEKDFLLKRRAAVAAQIQSVLGLKTKPSLNQVPTVAVVASGGGARACVGTLGSLKGLKEIGVLDLVSYITGVSGSTWAMSLLYQDENWSNHLDLLISRSRDQMTKTMRSCFTLDKIKYYSDRMDQKETEGHQVSFIDLFGLVIEHIVFGETNSSTLSEQQRTVSRGQNPLPIYTAVNVKEAIEGHLPEHEWLEFSPFEVGLYKYGAFIKAENFGSEFFLGHLIKKLQEVHLPFLLGIWSSVFSLNLSSLWKAMTGSAPKWSPEDTDVHTIEEDQDPWTLDTLLLSPESGLGASFSEFFKNRPIINETFNFTRGLSLHQDYSSSKHFLCWKDSHPDAFPNQLTPSDDTLRLIDSGHHINISVPPVLRPERLAELVIVLSYSWNPNNPFSVLEKTQEFCEDRNIPFPSPDYDELKKQPLREVYVFEDQENPTAPMVLFLPLVNVSYQEFKRPGVARSQEELAAGRVDVSSPESPYTTDNMTFSEHDYDALIDLTTYNVLNSRETILCALSSALRRKQGSP